LVVGLTRGSTYYWRINEVNDAHPDSPWIGDVWRFTVRGYKASNPIPPDGALLVPTNPLLQWDAGTGAAIHYVYFGTDFNDVQNATTDDPEFVAYVGAPDSNWAPVDDGGLTLNIESNYYWRIDETPDGVTMYKGDVWGFTTAGPPGGLRGEYYYHTGAASPPGFEFFVMSRIDPEINFEWGDGSPDPCLMPTTDD
jgi:hypothetical protein